MYSLSKNHFFVIHFRGILARQPVMKLRNFIKNSFNVKTKMW